MVEKHPKKSNQDNNIGIEDSSFAGEIAKRVSAVVGKDKANVVTAQIVALMSEKFSGPIAHPKHLREYEDICPGAADRIISMAEKALENQNSLEKTIVEGQIRDIREGRWFGFAALISLIGAALLCGLNGQPILAGAFLGTGVIGTIGIFIRGNKNGE